LADLVTLLAFPGRLGQQASQKQMAQDLQWWRLVSPSAQVVPHALQLTDSSFFSHSKP